MPEQKSVEDRLKDLEASVQTFDTKYEHGYAKAENVGAAAVAAGATAEAVGAATSFTGISGEVTGFSAGFRLWGYDYDLKARLEEAKLRTQRKDPSGLDLRIKELKTELDTFIRRIDPILNPINQQFPGVKNDVARAHTRIDGLRQNLRDSRDALEQERASIRRLRHTSLQAEPTLESLHRHVRTLATVLGG
ncbi:hypothetical protein [Streptomyces sp. SID10815]|uniref:hypothetical protein n=1 Tax=Streptomyces sp. SID10815 TaxID=2706027 RepID=UPI0013C6543F|nr:hypothetical protein [Streptomyces sp. SID10815]NEA50772.1 hypothetical protein [Streptomyces sp. SID10815]